MTTADGAKILWLYLGWIVLAAWALDTLRRR